MTIPTRENGLDKFPAAGRQGTPGWADGAEWSYSLGDALGNMRQVADEVNSLTLNACGGKDAIAFCYFQVDCGVSRMLCRYGRLVIGVLGNVYEDQWLTMEEFRQVLIAADERATAAMEDERTTFQEASELPGR